MTRLFLKRKINGYSASFFTLLLLLAMVSCKKEDFKNGKNILNSQYGANSVLVDTFQLKTYSVIDDSIRCKNQENTMLGLYNDPIFGKFNSSIYTNLLLENPGVTNFTSSPQIDSIVLSLQYTGYYGTPEDVHLQVYELNDLMNTTDTMYQFSQFNYASENLVDPFHFYYSPKPTQKVVVGSDTLAAQLRIRLKNSFAQHLIDGVQQGAYASQDAFKNFFKGLYIRIADNHPSPGKGAVYYFNMLAVNSGLTIYYKDADSTPKTFRYLINNKGVYFNHVDIDRAGTKVDQLVQNPNLGQQAFYMQAYGVRAVVEIPGLKNIPSNAIIHSAVLDLPFASYYLDKLYPSPSVTFGYFNNDDIHKPVTIRGGNLYNEASHSYSIDLNNFTKNLIIPQQIIMGKINTSKFFIIPDDYAKSAERVLFNGSNSTYKLKPKLTVIYTINE